MNNELYAVLTGDLVKSSRMSPEQSKSAMERLRQLAKEFEREYSASTIGQVDTFRHDSWQWLLAKPELALRAAVFMRAGLRVLSDGHIKFDTRIAIGTGTVETIAKCGISDSRGPAFTASGKALDAMKSNRLAYACAEDASLAEVCMADAVVPLVDCIATDWTAAEARAIHGALLGLTQEQLAANWPSVPSTGKRPTRQAIAKTLARAHWDAIDKALSWSESVKKQPPEVAIANSNLHRLHLGRSGSKAGRVKGV